MKANKIIRISLFSALLFALGLFCLGSFFSCRESTPYVSPYNWANLVNENERMTYFKNNHLASLTGIDVSDHQETIDWNAVSQDGIDFALIRLGNRGYTEGFLYLDKQFVANLQGAKQAGIKVGVYFFSQAVNEDEAREEAEFVVANLQGVQLDYPVAYDCEIVNDSQGRANNISREQRTKNAVLFCGIIQEKGFSAMIYGNKKDIALYDLKPLEQFDIWFAEYEAATPTGQFDFTIWQYSNNGSVEGIRTAVDMNIHFLEA